MGWCRRAIQRRARAASGLRAARDLPVRRRGGDRFAAFLPGFFAGLRRAFVSAFFSAFFGAFFSGFGGGLAAAGPRPPSARGRGNSCLASCVACDARLAALFAACARCLPSSSAIARPSSAGDFTVRTRAASSARYLSAAVPLPPAIIAPAWPMRLPGGAVTPAVYATTRLLPSQRG